MVLLERVRRYPGSASGMLASSSGGASRPCSLSTFPFRDTALEETERLSGSLRGLQQRRLQHFFDRRHEPHLDLVPDVIGRHLHVPLVLLRHNDFLATRIDGSLEFREDAADGQYLAHDGNLAG